MDERVRWMELPKQNDSNSGGQVMGHHYTKNTVSADARCNRCECIECYNKPLPVVAKVAKPLPERGLFDEVQP